MSVVCLSVPQQPLPLLFPQAAVAQVVESITLFPVQHKALIWMCGHIRWNSAEVPIISFSALIGAESDRETVDETCNAVILKTAANSAFSSYSALLYTGNTSQLEVDSSCTTQNIPDNLEERYMESVVEYQGKSYIVPNFSALAVAFSYI